MNNEPELICGNLVCAKRIDPDSAYGTFLGHDREVSHYLCEACLTDVGLA